MSIKSYKTQILLLYIIFIFLNSIISKDLIPKGSLKYDDFLHFIEFFILGFLLINAIIVKAFNINKFIICIVILTLIPLIDENLQYFFDIQGRRYDINDIKMDLVGSYCGVAIFMLIYKLRRKNG